MSAGVRKVEGKSNDCDENLKFSDKKPEQVKTLPVESDNEDHYKCMEA